MSEKLTMRRQLDAILGSALLLLAGWTGSCSKQEAAQVGSIVAIGAALKAVQIAQAKTADTGPPAGECCEVCEECTFPCGNQCISNGTFCFDPPGCACWQGESKPNSIPRESRPPAFCPNYEIR